MIPQVKKCSRCQEYLSVLMFHRNASRGHGFQSYCKPCRHIKGQEWNAGNPEKRRLISRKRKLASAYGMSPADEKWLWDLHGGRCGMCSAPLVGTSGAAVDHDHSNGRVRGLLCKPCNWALGHLRDDPEIARRAWAYLSASKLLREETVV